jgi:hypothetical protein
MFAHQVIEEYQSNMGEYTNQTYKDEANKAVSLIRQSAKFHMGDLDDVFNIFKSKNREDCFSKDIIYLKLPYPIMWFDFTHKHICHGDAPNTKEGILVKEINSKQWMIYTVTYHQSSKKWIIYPHKFIINITEGDSTVTPIFFIGDYENEGLKARFLREFAWVKCLLDYSVRLLNCKNIQTEKIKAPEALNKKRRKNGKQEIFDYHVLNVVVPSNNKRGYQEKSIPLSHNRVHLCRGHFKEYTTEHPLFGKYTGLWWWQPSVRGQNKDGIVIKDYSIKTIQEEAQNGIN